MDDTSNRPRVLVADDDQEVRSTLTALLENEGYEVIEAINGREAVALIAARRPDLIILDLYMPIMNGWEVLDQLEAERIADDVPVLVFAATAQPETSFGNVFMLRKGADAGVLLATVAEELSRHAQRSHSVS